MSRASPIKEDHGAGWGEGSRRGEIELLSFGFIWVRSSPRKKEYIRLASLIGAANISHLVALEKLVAKTAAHRFANSLLKYGEGAGWQLDCSFLDEEEL